MGDLLGVWLAGKARLRPKSQEACRGAARLVRLRWGSHAPAEVDQDDVAAWLGGLTGVGGGLASASLRRQVLQALGGALAIGQRRGLVRLNVAREVRVRAEAGREPVFLTGAQLAALAGEARDPGAVLLLGTCGLRIGEACALDVGDVVVRGKVRRLRVRRSKNGSPRDVPISSMVLGRLSLDRPRGEPLLLSPGGTRLDPHNFRKRDLAKASAAVGLAVRPHDLRHTAASLAIASGADVKAVQRMLGHGSAAVTLGIYAHLFDERLDEVADRIADLLPT